MPGGAHELGQKNYQHPRRGTSDFGAHIDHFSHWVIYLSLVALAAQPALWQRLRGGDECLLLRRADFEKPGQSAALNALLAARDSRTSQLAQAFQALLALDLEKIPPLGAVPDGLSGPPEIIFPCDACGQSLRLPGGVAVRHVRCPSCGWVRPEAASAAARPEWLRDHLPQHGASAESRQTGVAKELPDLTWIFEGLSPSTQPADFEGAPRLERIFFILCSFACTAVAVAWVASLLPGVLVLIVMGSSAIVGPLFIWLHYREQPAVIRRRVLERVLAGKQSSRNREMGAYRHLSFGRYCRRVIGAAASG